MEPANPPLPTPMKRPFQFCSGIQTSKRIVESLVGRITPVTLQNAGNPVTGGRDEEMETAAPAAIDSAVVMEVSWRLRDLSEPQSAAKRSPGENMNEANSDRKTRAIFSKGKPPGPGRMLRPFIADEACEMDGGTVEQLKRREQKAFCGRSGVNALQVFPALVGETGFL